MGTTKTERREILRKRREAIDAELHRLAARDRGEKRKQDTRRKILLGAILEQEMATKPSIQSWAMKLADERLTRANDRLLFGLAPLENGAQSGRAAKVGIGTLASGAEGPAIVPVELQRPQAANRTQPLRPPGSQTSKTAQENRP